jgi:hypothetical protein
MSAFAAIAYEDRVELISDGATVDAEGNLAVAYRKIYKSDYAPLAFTARGHTGACIALWVYISGWARAGSFDKTIVHFQEFLSSGAGKIGEYAMDGAIVGISETGGPRVLYFTTSPDIEGCEPFVLIDNGGFASGGPEPDGDALNRYNLHERVHTETLAEFGADLMEASRPTKMKHNGMEVYGVGAHVDLVTVRADGAIFERLRTWPDKVGEKIDPARCAA